LENFRQKLEILEDLKNPIKLSKDYSASFRLMIFYDLIDLTEFLIANLVQHELSKAERVSLFYVASTYELVAHED
jgi:hypothetical protein